LAANHCHKMRVVFYRMYSFATLVLECFFLVLLEKRIHCYDILVTVLMEIRRILR